MSDEGGEVIDLYGAAVLGGYIRDSWRNAEQYIEDQRAAIHDWAESNGFQIVDYVERGVRGDRPLDQRPVLSRLVAAVEDGHLRGVIVAWPDRLSRSKVVAEQIRHRVWKTGAKNYTAVHGETIKGSGDLDTQNIQRLLDQGDENEVWAIRARRERGRAAKRARQGYLGGQRFGGRPYGRDLIPHPTIPGKWEYRPVAAEQAVIRRIGALRAKGIAYCEIARRLNAEGVPTVTGVPWVHKTIRDLALRGPSGLMPVPEVLIPNAAVRSARDQRRASA